MKTINRNAILMFCLVFALAGAATTASASALITVNVTDDVYGSFSGSIQQGATGAAATLSWMSAGYYWAGDIDLTNGAGIINADIRTNNDDTYTLFAPGSGYPTLGSMCVSGGSTACVIATGLPQSLFLDVSAMNGGPGICCGGSDIVVTDNASIPEPASMSLMVIGILGLIVGRRKVRRTSSAN